VAVADDAGHVYVLGVVEPLPNDNKLFLDVVADWQVNHRLINQLITLFSRRSLGDHFNTHELLL